MSEETTRQSPAPPLPSTKDDRGSVPDVATPSAVPPVRRRAWRRKGRWLGAAALALLVVAFAVLMHRISDVVRGTPVRSVVRAVGARAVPAVSGPHFLPAAAGLTSVDLAAGHTVEVLIDEAVFDRMFAEIRAATRSVTLFVYYCEPGLLGDRLASILAERARAGVEVLVLGDGFGCRRLIRAIEPALDAAGADVALFRPLRWYSLHRAQHRNHSRSVVIDGVIAYTGGFGLSDEWLIGESDEPVWRDTAVRYTGPAVRQTQGSFLAAWAEATGELHAGSAFYPADEPGDAAGTVAGLLYSSPGLGTTPAERYFALTVAAAERTLRITNSYFVPTPLLLELLIDAAGRGVDVRLLVPGPRTDIHSTRYAGRGLYRDLLAAGVRIFEYQPTMMHAKTIVADGVWSSVGSINFDNRSIRLNDESALIVYDPDVGAVLDSLFASDVRDAREITAAGHRDRAVWERLVERVTRLVAPLL